MTQFDYDWDRLQSLGFTEEATGQLKEACWKGYTAVGTKKKDGKEVPNCVPIKKSEHREGDIATAEMTPNYLPKEPIPGGGDLKNPEMNEHKMRMPRMEALQKANAKDSQLAMAARPNYSEWDPFDSDESNGGMSINQLRAIRENVDIILSMLEPGDNLPPWVATKLAVSSNNLTSVADFLQFGSES